MFLLDHTLENVSYLLCTAAYQLGKTSSHTITEVKQH